MIKIISWNLARRSEAWNALLTSNADIALVQEACEPPSDLAEKIGVDSAPWTTEGAGMLRSWRASVVRLSSKVDVQQHTPRPIRDANSGDFAISRLGTLAAADARIPGDEETLTFVSVYAPWENAHRSTESSWIYADASAHRAISDLSIFIGQQRAHRMIVAGDLNVLHGYGEDGSRYWAERYQSVFDRMKALGLDFIGPQSPNGRQADPWPSELPAGSRNVPTFRSNQQSPATATRQLDFVFASRDLAPRINVKALNAVEDWGPSDHCRIEINLVAPNEALVGLQS